jgi:hypothetical protein
MYDVAIDFDYVENHISEMKEWVKNKKNQGYKVDMVII